MINKLKLPVIFLLSSFIIFSAAPTALCADPCIDSTMNIPAEVQTGKSFEATVNLASLNSSSNLGTVLLTVNFDSSVITYKSASLISSKGSINDFCNGNTLKIIYLNTAGLSLSEGYSDIIKLKFTAPNNACSSNISIGASQAVSVNEQYLSVNDNIEYTLSFSEKAVNSSVSASGRRIQNTASSASSRSKSSKASSNSKQSSKVKASSETGEEQQGLNSLNINTEQSPFFSYYILFLSGIVFACGIGVIIFIAYKVGKKNGKNGINEDAAKTEETAQNSSEKRP